MFTGVIDHLIRILLLMEQAILIYIHSHRAMKITLTHAWLTTQQQPNQPAVQSITQGDEIMILKDNQNAQFALNPNNIVDVKGNPAPVQDGSVIWGTSDPSLLTVDPVSGLASAVGPLGHVQLLVSADADLGDGVKTIQGIKEIDIVASEAVAINIGDVTPVDQ